MEIHVKKRMDLSMSGKEEPMDIGRAVIESRSLAA